MTFTTIVMVDWSGGGDRGATPKKDAIWAAVIREGVAEPSIYLRNRATAENWLQNLFAAEIAAGRRVLAGFDFPFGYPTGFSAQLVGRPDPMALWDWFAGHLHDGPGAEDRYALAAAINRRFPGTGPFWFNGGSADLPELPRKGRARDGHGMAERRLCEERAKGAFTLWQMGGAGAVGSQAMTGMASLSRLRARFSGRVKVWPFEPLDAEIAFVEVWPSLFARDVAAAMRSGDIKDAVQVQVLAARVDRMQREGTLDTMLAAPPEAARREEGWILGVDFEDALIAPIAPLTPPRLRNDCFAMPQGVDWVKVSDALALLQAGLVTVALRDVVGLVSAQGRVLATDQVAPRANPPAPNSAVDGYGFAHASTGAGVQRLALVTGRAAAGQPFGRSVLPGHAIRILTGAVLPEGVDTVVLEEDCAVNAKEVAFDGPVKARINTRRMGEDIGHGAVALSAGHRLRAPDLALLAAVGISRVDVYRPLRVAVLSTGDEIVSDIAENHQTYDANRPMLMALAKGWGCEVVDLGHAPDRPATIRARLNRGAARADAILVSGGASAGDEDHVARLLRAEGNLTAWRIAMKPGRPLALALWQGVPVFGLPGNPVAAFICALIFARPALSTMAGAGWVDPAGFTVPAAFAKAKKAGRREYLRARLNAAGAAEVFASEGSGRISGLAWATGLVELPDAALTIAPGDPVRFLPYASFGV